MDAGLCFVAFLVGFLYFLAWLNQTFGIGGGKKK
jgi:hypothetical protein